MKPILTALALITCPIVASSGQEAKAQAAPASTPFTPTSLQNTAMAEAVSEGRDLYDFDQAAWISTDAMLAAVPDPAKAGIRGWIVERDSGDLVATYFGQVGGDYRQVYVARVRDGKVVSSHLLEAGEDSAVTAVQRRMIVARAIATAPEARRKADVTPCTPGAMNSVVLVPRSPDADVSVYVLSSQPSIDSYPMGGHYRIDVAANGKIVRSRGFAKSCLMLDKSKVPGGAQPAAFTLSHLLDPQPTPIHVWTSLASGIPLMVVTVPAGEIWAVERGMIRPVAKLPPGAPNP